MSKDPAVLFYTSDFLSGTFTMTNEQVGMYIRLLCYQHQKGKLSEKDMLAVCPSRDEEVWGKFNLEDGFYVNKKMYEEAERRKKFTESRSKNRKSKNISSTYENHMIQHMETETVTITKTESKEGGMGGDWQSTKKSFFASDEWMYQFCTAKSLSKDRLTQLMNEFIQDIELRNEFKNLKELKNHFTNWYNKSKTKNAKPNRNTGAYELLDELRAEYQAGRSGYDFGTTDVQP